MRVNSSSGVSLLSPRFCFSNSSLYPHFFRCFDCTFISTCFTAFTCTNLLLLPVYVLVLWKGFQRWRRRCSTTAGSASHSDVFIYHSVTVEIIAILGLGFYCISIYTCSPRTLIFGYCALFLTYPGQTLFHSLTCVERYLAVVHPVIYRGLRKEVGVRVRNISIGCVWLISFGIVCFLVMEFPKLPSTLLYVIFAITVIVIVFSSFCVLHALIRLGLWKVGGDRRQIDQSKQRAFHTVMAITGALGFRLSGLLIFNIVFDLSAGIGTKECVFSLIFAPWLCVPSSLVLPLLFLHRAGTLACCSSNQSEKLEQTSIG